MRQILLNKEGNEEWFYDLIENAELLKNFLGKRIDRVRSQVDDLVENAIVLIVHERTIEFVNFAGQNLI